MARSFALALCTGLVLAAPTPALAADKDGKGDPPGNNGTVKIGAVPLDKAPHANQPHVGCTFSLRFFGFDDDQTADITFTGQAPTKAGVLLTQKGVAISDDPAGGGKDADAVLTYTADQLGLKDVTPAKQGWHVKVAVDVLEAPGGAKQKVFWLSCPAAQPALRTETAPTAGGGTTTSGTGTTTTGTTTNGTTTTGTGTTTSPPDTAVGGVSVSAPEAVTRETTERTYGSGVLDTSAVAGAGAGVGSGTAQTGGGLPFTGDETGRLVLLGLGALGLGTAATAAARRRKPATR